MTDLPTGLIADCASAFAGHYNGTHRWMALAPGRVNLIGDHTDYSGGLALPLALDLYTVVCAAPGESPGQVRLYSNGQHVTLDISAPMERAGDWADYVRGVIAGFQQRGLDCPPLDICIAGNLPLGAGLSSSASLELAVATLLEAIGGISLEPVDKALLCQRAEHDFAGVPCGILDQFAIALGRAGHLLRLDCQAQSVDWVACPAGVELLVIDSAVSHSLADGAYAERRRECEAADAALPGGLRQAVPGAEAGIDDPVIRARARHVIGENRRVDDFIAALGDRDWPQAGRIMRESHHSLAADYAVSCEELDYLVGSAMDAGAFGARMTGGGFGGSVICLVPPGCAASIGTEVAAAYRSRFDIEAGPRVVRPVDGAALVAD